MVRHEYIVIQTQNYVVLLEVKGSLINPNLEKKGDNSKILFKVWLIQN